MFMPAVALKIGRAGRLFAWRNLVQLLADGIADEFGNSLLTHDRSHAGEIVRIEIEVRPLDVKRWSTHAGIIAATWLTKAKAAQSAQGKCVRAGRRLIPPAGIVLDLAKGIQREPVGHDAAGIGARMHIGFQKDR
jgi:hypothetical protein